MCCVECCVDWNMLSVLNDWMLNVVDCACWLLGIWTWMLLNLLNVNLNVLNECWKWMLNVLDCECVGCWICWLLNVNRVWMLIVNVKILTRPHFVCLPDQQQYPVHVSAMAASGRASWTCWLRGERVLGRLYGVRCVPTTYGAPPSVLTTRKHTTLGGAAGSAARCSALITFLPPVKVCWTRRNLYLPC